MRNLIKELINNTECDYEDVAIMINNIIISIEDMDDIELKENLSEIENYITKDTLEELTNELDDGNFNYIVESLERNMKDIFMDLNLCPKCGKELHKAMRKEMYEYMGREFTNNELDCLYCDCGFKEY